MAKITYKAAGPDGGFEQTGDVVNVEVAGSRIKAALVRTDTMTKLVHVGSGMVMHEMSSVHKAVGRGLMLDSFFRRITGKEQTVLSVIRAQESLNPVPRGFL